MKLIYWSNRKSKFGIKTYPKCEFYLLRAEFHFKPVSKTGA